MSARTTAPSWPLVALFTAGYLAPYLLPTTVGRLDAALPLSATQAGAVGSLLLLSSAAAGFALASRIHRLGARRLARVGLLLAVAGYGTAALSTSVPTVIAGALVGGLGSGAATTVAAAGTAARPDPHRTTTLGLLSVSALAAAVYLTVPHLGPGHGLPLAAVALTAALVWPATARLPAGQGPATGRRPAPPSVAAHRPAPGPTPPLPHRRPGLVLAAAMLCWSLAQNSLWGVSSHIGTRQAGLGEATVGVVFAAALGAGLLGVLGAGALGPRIGRALPVGAGTALIAVCIVVSANADGLTSFAVGEIAWNALYPVVLSYLISLAASLDPHGRWAVLAGSASSLGTACGPLAGSLLSAAAGYPAMGWVLATALVLLAVPLAAVALRTTGGPVVRGPEPVLRGGPVEQPAEQPVVEIAVDRSRPAQGDFDTAGPPHSGTSPAAPAP
ncbi:MFS transporter [Streptomyces sp. NBC_00414]|uniref:MFS transporter n=1 Tax=Streptomyces sp. NBC_00414 TaxID=2975739 RepID=UPI002E20C3CC